MRTKDLVETFQAWWVSGEHTAAKDVSIAKGELFQKDLIVARHGIRNIALTDAGERVAGELVSAIESALEHLINGQKDLVLIQEALSSIKPKRPEKALSSVDIHKKPAVSERTALGTKGRGRMA